MPLRNSNQYLTNVALYNFTFCEINHGTSMSANEEVGKKRVQHVRFVFRRSGFKSQPEGPLLN